jgi:hypothetical protein
MRPPAEAGINVLRGPKIDTHVRSTILVNGNRGVWISTVMLKDRRNAAAETMAYEFGEQDHLTRQSDGTYKIEFHDLLDGPFTEELFNAGVDSYASRADALRGHRRALRAVRRVMSGQPYTRRFRGFELGEVELDPKKVKQELGEEQQPGKIIPLYVPFDAAGAQSVLDSVFIDNRTLNEVIEAAVSDALDAFGVQEDTRRTQYPRPRLIYSRD